MRVAIETHGCRLNQAEGDAIERVLREAGHEIVAPEDAELFVLNSCTITHNADADARQRVRRAHRDAPMQSIVVTGCYANSAPEELAALPGVALVAGNAEKDQLLELIAKATGLDAQRTVATAPPALISVEKLTRQLARSGRQVARERVASRLPASRSRRRTRAFLKIQDGCNYACAFCIVPQVRGKNRSYARPELLERFRELQDAGAPEVVLTGVHLGTFGWDLGERDGLERLVHDLLHSPGDAWIRLGSLDPHEVRPGLIDLFERHGGGRLCRHLHLPVQSGSNRILRSMRRAHSAEDLRVLVPELRRRCPDMAIGTDVIVGFPGEDDASFDETYALFESLRIDYAHVFTYSKRENTEAATMADQVDEGIKRRRNRQLRNLVRRHWEQFRGQLEGTTQHALVLERQAKSGKLSILTDNYVPLLLDGPDALIGHRIAVRVGALCTNEQFAELLD